MIYSLNTFLKPFALKVMYKNMAISYSWGDVDALHKWIESMNKKQLDASLGIQGNRKYPLIWLVENWEGKEKVPGIEFRNVNFYIAINSKIETLNESRIESFKNLYKVANDFIKELKKMSRIEDDNISYFEKANFNTVGNGTEKKAFTSDVWDVVILNLDLHIVNLDNCFNNN